jgi:hypothetical protein
MKLRILITSIFLLFTGIFYGQETTSNTFGKGMIHVVAKDSSWSINFAPRIQILSSFYWDEVNDKFVNPEQNTLIRRARLKFNGFVYSPKLKYKIELGLSNRDISGASVYTKNSPRIILDAVIKWNFYKNFEIWFGQTKLPGNRERVVSSGNLQFVDRSLLNSKFNIDRDLGIQIHHHFLIGKKFVTRQIVAISQGEGRNVTSGNLGGNQYTGRLEFLPLGTFQGKGDYVESDLKRETKPKVSFGISYDHNNNAVKTRSNMGNYMETDFGLHQTNIDTWFVDTMFKYKGFSFMGEYANRDASKPIALHADGTPTGDVVEVGDAFNIQAGYLLKNNLEFSARYTTINFDKQITGKSELNQYTIGASKYIVSHKLKVQTDCSYLNNQGGNNQLLYRFQVELHF